MLSQLFDVIPDAMLVVDAEGRIELANPQAETMFGYPPQGLAGVVLEALMPEGVRHRHRMHRAGYMDNPRLRPMGGSGQTLIGQRRDGSEFPIEIALGSIHTENGTRYLASIRDISESQRARQVLVRARYDGLVARIGQLVLASTDEETAFGQLPAELAAALDVEAVVIVSAASGHERLQVRTSNGLSKETESAVLAALAADSQLGQVIVTGQPLIVEDFADPLYPCTPMIETGLRSGLLVALLDRDRPVGALMALSTRPHSFDHDALHCLQSTANLVSTLIQRRHTEEQLAHSQRLDAVGQLTGGIAHDFNNLLTVVSGNLQLLEDECPENPAIRDLVESAQRAVGHGAALTRKLLAFARRQHLSPRPIHPGPMLQEIGTMLRRTLGELVKVEIQSQPDIAPIYADLAQLESALLNLSLNARDAMPRGGKLTIAVREIELRSEAERMELKPGRYVVFTIADTGHGMAPGVLAHAFEPFFTTKEPGKGNGLGLSMVYGFVKQSGGQLHAESRLGYGTRIELFLPAALSVGEESAEPEAVSAWRGNESILVVEDEPAVRDIAVAFLHSLGYRVQAVDDAAKALQRLAADPTIALLFSDVALGDDMNGAELGIAAQRLRPDLPVLLTSGYEHHDLPLAGENAGHFHLLRKPYRREELAAAVRSQLDQ